VSRPDLAMAVAIAMTLGISNLGCGSRTADHALAGQSLARIDNHCRETATVSLVENGVAESKALCSVPAGESRSIGIDAAAVFEMQIGKVRGRLALQESTTPWPPCIRRSDFTISVNSTEEISVEERLIVANLGTAVQNFGPGSDKGVTMMLGTTLGRFLMQKPGPAQPIRVVDTMRGETEIQTGSEAAVTLSTRIIRDWTSGVR
jgi:hypothetical protein